MGDDKAVPRPGAAAPPARTWAPVFVWAVWAATAIVGVVIVARHARRYPYSNDWEIVDVVAGRRAFSLGWLWSQTAEHRLPFPRLVMWSLTSLDNGDFRITMWLMLVLLAGFAAVAILTLHRVRGATAYSDAFFPLVLLAPFQGGLTWAFAFHFTSVALASLGVLLIMFRFGLDAPSKWRWVAVALMVVLFGGGGPGLALLPGLLAWLVLTARRLRTRDRRAAGWTLGAAGGFVVGVALYFVGFHRPAQPPATVSGTVRIALRLATGSGGPRTFDWWPITGVGVVVVLGATALMLVWRARSAESTPAERDRAVAVLCFGAALVSLLAAFGLGRAAYAWTPDLVLQYSPLAIPGAVWVYVAWADSGPRLRTGAGLVLLTGALLVYVINIPTMRTVFADRARLEHTLTRDRCRLTPADLVERYPHALLVGPNARERRDVARAIAAMRRHHLSGFDCGS